MFKNQETFSYIAKHPSDFCFSDPLDSRGCYSNMSWTQSYAQNADGPHGGHRADQRWQLHSQRDYSTAPCRQVHD